MRKTIWVIDDDIIYRVIIKKIIEKSGIFAPGKYYENGNIALNELNNSPNILPDLILLDINMPVIDGWQFVEVLKNSHPNLAEKTKIYIVSSSIALSDLSKANGIKEISGFVSKPLTVTKLLEIGVDV